MVSLLVAVPFAVHGAVVSDFSSDLDGWAHAGGDASTLTWLSSGGVPGGYMRMIEPATGGVDRFAAPAKFLGDQSAMYGGTLSYDIRISPAENLANPDIRLLGNSLTLEYYFVSAPTGTFSNFSATLDENSGWVIAGGGTPTQGQFQSVLANLTALQISADWSTVSDTTSLDNVVLVPEPSTTALLGLGLLGLLRRRR